MRRLVLLFLLPLIYARYHFLYLIIFLYLLISSVSELKDLALNTSFVLSSVMSIAMSLINAGGVLTKITNIIIKTFHINVTYHQLGSGMTYSASHWETYDIETQRSTRTEAIAVMGGAMYKIQDNIKRKAIFDYFWQ